MYRNQSFQRSCKIEGGPQGFKFTLKSKGYLPSNSISINRPPWIGFFIIQPEQKKKLSLLHTVLPGLYPELHVLELKFHYN